MISRVQIVCLVHAVFAVASPAVGSGFDADLAKRTQTVNASYEYEIPVDKSNTIEGTDFGTGQRFGLSVYTGTTKALGLGIRNDHSATKFTQADGSVATEWTDFTVSYRFMMLYPTLTMGSTSFKARQAGVDLANALGISRGGGLGVRIPAGIATVQFEALYVAVPKAIDAGGYTIEIGPRTDIDMGVALEALTEHFVVTTGYRYRTYAVSIDGASASELETGPYLGFRLGFSP